MKAGKTQLDVGVRVRVTGFVSNDPEDRALIGIEGEITHPFPGAMIGSSGKYIAGLHIDDEQRKRFGLAEPIMNLIRGDTFEIVVSEPDDLAIAAMAALAHWHSNTRNFRRKEPAYLNLIRAALKKRGFMSPSGAALYRVDFDRVVREAIEAAA